MIMRVENFTSASSEKCIESQKTQPGTLYDSASLNHKTKMTPQAVQTVLQHIASYYPASTLASAPPLHYAAMRGDVEKLRQVQDPSLFESKDEKGLTPLHYAILTKEKEAISYLLEKCDPAYQTPQGNSYLHYAALSGDLEILDLFFNRGLNRLQRNQDLLSPSHLWALVSDDPIGLQKLGLQETEPLQFTAQDLFAIKQLGKEGILSDHDWQLFRTNLADLSVIGLSFFLAQKKTSNLFTAFLSLLHHSLGVVKSASIQPLASTPQDQLALGLRQAVSLKAMSWFSGFQAFSFAQAGTSAFVVFQHIFNGSLKTSCDNWPKTLSAYSIRAFNSAATILDTYLSLEYPSYPSSCSILTSDKQLAMQNMTFQERIDRFPELIHAPCPDAQLALLAPNETTIDCASLKKVYRKVSLATHPDKGGNTTAFDILRTIYDTLCLKK